MTTEEQPPSVLPFSPEMQEAVLGHLLINEKFFLKCKDKIQSEWFVEPNCQRIWSALQEYHKRYSRFPTKPALMDAREIKLEAQAKQNVISSKIETAKYNATKYPIEQIQDQLTEWMHVRYFLDGQKNAQKFFNQKQLPKAFGVMDHTLKNIRETQFDGYEAVDFSNVNKLLEDDDVRTDGALSSGLTIFDKLLLPKAKGAGAFLPGQSTVVMAPINAGKSAFMLTIAIHNI
jgi:replicative DNA helicase